MKDISLSDISDIITEVDLRITSPINTGIITFIKKSHARIRVVIGAGVFVLGMGGAVLSYLMRENLQSTSYFLLIGISGLGIYSTGKYSLRKMKRPNKRFETVLIPYEKL